MKRLLILALAACGGSAPSPAPVVVVAPPSPVVAQTIFSDPDEYAIERISRDAGEAIFTRTGIGDPYRTGVPYPIFLALFELAPAQFGKNWDELASRYGFVARKADPASADLDLREGLPLGMHLTVDPITNVPFVMTNCVLCHAEHVAWKGGEATVIGLGNKRVRIHAYDAAFTDFIATKPSPATVARAAATAATAKKITWPDNYAQPLVAATLDAIARRQASRTELIARTRDGVPGRVATIDAFVVALTALSHASVQYSPQVGWAKVPDVVGFPVRTTLSWDGSQQGAMDVLAIEADLAAGIAVEWLQRHPFQGASLGAFLRQPMPRPAFPLPLDKKLVERGRALFEDDCSNCHGHYGSDGHVFDYTEHVIPLEDVLTDSARAMGATESFERAANQEDVTHGFTTYKRTGGYVPPVLTNVWMRGPYGHAGQWASLAVIAQKPDKRVPVAFDLAAPYDLVNVGVATKRDGARDDKALLVGHPFLSDLGKDAPAVIEYLKSL